MAKIKRIQLRGISRTPSDRLVEDGGCAESLNVFLDNDEIAPAVAPLDVTADLMEEELTEKPIYIHATQTYRNVIRQAGRSISFDTETIVYLGLYESLSDITHIGNTLIIATTKNLHYLLFKDGAYKSLGNGITLPSVSIVSDCTIFPQETIHSDVWVDGQPNQDEMFSDKWNEYDSEGNNTYATAKGVATLLDGMLTEATTNSSKAETHFVWPFVARYAVRLYNGSVITSVPFLVAPQNVRGFSEAIASYLWREEDGNPKERITLNTKISYFQPLIKLLDYEQTEQWSDIIKGIDIYFSDKIMPDKTDCIGVRLTSSAYDSATAVVDLGGNDWSEEEAILDKRVFFKVASYDFTDNDLAELREGVKIPFIKSEDLLVKEQLDPFDDVMESHSIVPQRVMAFNNRLLAGDIRGKINSGPKVLTSTDGTNEYEEEWYFRFFVESGGETKEVIRKNVDDENMFADFTPYSWITYPDVHCTRVEVCTASGLYASIKMKEHPNLNCSYGYLGRYPLRSYVSFSNDSQGVLSDPEDTEYMTPNKLLLSEVDNPMVFPITSRYNVGTGGIIGMAVATKALSQGQFGQFPLYVFTTDGIWTMATTAEGTFASVTPLSRDVCTNAKSIASLEQEVVFTTKKGVMLLSGSDIVELSPNMNGKHYVIESTAQSIISAQPGFKFLTGTLEDATLFRSFLGNTRCAYDYVGKRLILINPDFGYQYIYSFATQTWHKIDVENYVIKDVLNSYPECYVYAEDSEGYACILNMSVVEGEEVEPHSVKGVIATRTFDLDEPDILKTITDVRVRGEFQKGAVKFILQGTQDGIHFYTISTLRGKAWKKFRIILLTDLNVHERVSWIDIMYESKFDNRLR